MTDIAHEWHAVAFDVTHYYTLQAKDVDLITGLFDVFFYDVKTATYLCELTPSYHLRYLYTYAVSTDQATDDDRERIDERYCYVHTEDTYMHVGAVQGIAKAHPDQHAKYEHDATEDEIREYWQGNYPL